MKRAMRLNLVALFCFRNMKEVSLLLNRWYKETTPQIREECKNENQKRRFVY
jgi:hypothetical protein